MNKLPPYLYHGTRAHHLDSILQEGLLPRRFSGESQWEHSAESRDDAVYLTTAYPLHYAAAARGQGDLVILELDTSKLDRNQLIADEDVLAHCMRTPETEGMPFLEKTLYYRGVAHEYCALDSLAKLGTCSHLGVIPPSAISRIVRISAPDAGVLIVGGFDPVVSPQNFRFFGETYKAGVAWLFGDLAECPVNPNMPRVSIEIQKVAPR